MASSGLDEILDQAAPLVRSGQIAAAEQIYRHGLERFPDSAILWCNIAVTLCAQHRIRDALPLFDRAIALDPNHTAAHFNKGLALGNLQDYAASIPSLHEAAHLDPNHLAAFSTLGVSYIRLGRTEEALAAFRRASELAPNIAVHQAHMAQVLTNIGRFDEAAIYLRRAMELDPANPEYRMVWGFDLLRHGRFAEGWPFAESRLHIESFQALHTRFHEPVWKGESLGGRTIYLQPEQGFGDMIQFIRYGPLIAARGGRLIVGCHAPLKTLLATAAGVVATLAPGETLLRLDTWISAMSLPRIFHTDLSNIPTAVPYLFPDAVSTSAWKEKLNLSPGRLSVGLVWAGNPEHPQDQYRSMHLSDFAPLAEVKNVRFYALQKGPRSEEAESPPAGMDLVNVGPQLGDFAGSAALMANLDLLISVDTAAVHLAGAIGRPVWTLVHVAPDWRWMLDREDSPWYPTMRLFRQRTLGEWDDVMERVGTALAQFPHG